MRRLLFLSVSIAAAAVAAAAPALAAQPVPSLTPQATQRLWSELVRHEQRLATDCRPIRGIFYAQTDWMRLATRLAAAGPCAQIFVSVPPIAGNKTTFRADQAWRIRALGRNFHALAEVNFTAWSNWVTANATTFYAAGQQARRNMAAAGYDVSLGDTWALNELSSAVRRGAGSARQNARDFALGLAAGDGVPVKGVVFISGINQSTADLSVYKANLQAWLTDAAFWTDMSGAVSDWSQEVYGDIRDYAVPDAAPATRVSETAAYLGHELNLANAGPGEAATARSFLESAYSPLANAAWAWSSAYGYTAVPFDQMQDYVTAQVAAAGGHYGFAWAPSNTLGLTTADFNAQTAAILDRLGAAMADPDPCAAWCTTSLDGAAFNEGWNGFSTWTTPAPTFTSAPVTTTAGIASGPLTLQVPAGTTVTLTSSSPAGQFSTSPAGPWTPTLSFTGGTFYYLDTVAGTPTISAGTVTQVETVVADA